MSERHEPCSTSTAPTPAQELPDIPLHPPKQWGGDGHALGPHRAPVPNEATFGTCSLGYGRTGILGSPRTLKANPLGVKEFVLTGKAAAVEELQRMLLIDLGSGDASDNDDSDTSSPSQPPLQNGQCTGAAVHDILHNAQGKVCHFGLQTANEFKYRQTSVYRATWCTCFHVAGMG